MTKTKTGQKKPPSQGPCPLESDLGSRRSSRESLLRGIQTFSSRRPSGRGFDRDPDDNRNTDRTLQVVNGGVSNFSFQNCNMLQMVAKRIFEGALFEYHTQTNWGSPNGELWLGEENKKGRPHATVFVCPHAAPSRNRNVDVCVLRQGQPDHKTPELQLGVGQEQVPIVEPW